MKTKALRFWGWGIPIFFICLAAFVVYVQTQALQEAQAKRNKAEKAVSLALQAQEDAERHPLLVKYAAEEQNASEESGFLDFLRKTADTSGVTIASWTSSSSSYANSNDQNADLIKGITRINSILSLTGPYPALRKFVESLITSERLFTLSNINWTYDTKGGIALNCTLSRYVEPPGTSLKPPALASSSAGSTSSTTTQSATSQPTPSTSTSTAPVSPKS